MRHANASTSSEIVRRLLARDAVAAPDERGGPKVAAQALQQSCTRTTDALWRSIGTAGSSALLTRAFARTEGDHPILKALHKRDGDSIRIDGVAASVDAHGLEAVTAAVEALLTSVIDILTRLIGEDMATRLISGDDIQRPPHGAPVR